jgi:ABC transporter ATM
VRVLAALGLLVGGKLLNVQVPFFFKDIVDSLNVEITANTGVWVLAGASVAGCESGSSGAMSEGTGREEQW